MKTVKARLKHFVKSVNLSEGKFERETGISRGAVSNVGAGLNTTTLDRITAKFPQLNTTWLLKGEGEMIKTEVETNDKIKSVVNQKKKLPDKEIDNKILLEKIEDLKEIISLQRKLLNTIEDKKEDQPPMKRVGDAG